jgi:hypothetical protein
MIRTPALTLNSKCVRNPFVCRWRLSEVAFDALRQSPARADSWSGNLVLVASYLPNLRDTLRAGKASLRRLVSVGFCGWTLDTQTSTESALLPNQAGIVTILAAEKKTNIARRFKLHAAARHGMSVDYSERRETTLTIGSSANDLYTVHTRKHQQGFFFDRKIN